MIERGKSVHMEVADEIGLIVTGGNAWSSYVDLHVRSVGHLILFVTANKLSMCMIYIQ